MARAAAPQRSSPAVATSNPRTEISPAQPNESEENRATPRLAPNPGTTDVTGRAPRTLPFESLTARDSRYSNDGNQFTSEPPDQALCVGNGYTMAGVNSALAVYDGKGAQLAPTLSNAEFFGLAPEYNRSKVTFGPSTFDPVCLYDQETRRWFYLVDELDTDPFSGNLTGGSHLFFAVSTSANPLGGYAFYSITTTNGDRTDRGCPCFDDFPHVGADANGFYITANRFPLFTNGFNGAQIYAISKTGLAANAAGTAAPPTVVSINAGSVDGDEPSFTVQPASVPPGGRYAGNREYFLSTTDADTLREDKIAIWALSNTDSLAKAEPRVKLTRRTIPSLTYAAEPNVEQKPGRSPLAHSVGEELNSLDSGSDMSEVEFSQGRLWAATGTAVGGRDAKRDGVLWFQVNPNFVNHRVGGSIVKQDYLAVRTNSVFYPAVGVNAKGEGAMVMSLAGPGVNPSPSYIEMDLDGVHGPVRVPEFGQRPDDGFTCYAAFVGDRDRGCRFGDYSSATADANGRIWMATEWISSGPRLPFANWSTEVLRFRP